MNSLQAGLVCCSIWPIYSHIWWLWSYSQTLSPLCCRLCTLNIHRGHLNQLYLLILTHKQGNKWHAVMAVIYGGAWGMIPPRVPLHHHGDTCAAPKCTITAVQPARGGLRAHTRATFCKEMRLLHGDNSANCCKQQMKNLNASRKNEEENDWNGISSHETPTDRVISGFSIIHQLTDASVKCSTQKQSCFIRHLESGCTASIGQTPPLLIRSFGSVLSCNITRDNITSTGSIP